MSGHEQWHRNGHNLAEVIIIRDGPDAQGRRYVDGRHQISVAHFARMEDAEQACREHNSHAALVEALNDALRMLEAVRLSAGLGTHQMERIAKHKAALAAAKGESDG